MVGLIVFLVGGMTGLVAYSPTLYRMFCAVTGFGGTVRSGVAPEQTSQDQALPLVTVRFDSNVDSGLDWDFGPEEREVRVRIGESKKIYYFAKNNSDKTIVGRAVFNVTPYKAAPYFFKIECFCFTEERLGPGEEARMPVVFYIDKQFLKDPEMEDVTRVTLSYTFFAQDDLSAEAVEAARDLKGGSVALDEALGQEGAEAVFDNDAPRK